MPSGRQRIVTAYSLTFGSLLLFGGRVADLFGRKRPVSPGASRCSELWGVTGMRVTPALRG